MARRRAPGLWPEWQGPDGRAAELVGHARLALARGGPLAGRRVVVTAGGTQEPLDPVRVITNRSSRQAGLCPGPGGHRLRRRSDLDCGARWRCGHRLRRTACDVRTAQEMLEAVLAALHGADALLMAAAVADFRPARRPGTRSRKRQGSPAIELEPPRISSPSGEAKRPRLPAGWWALPPSRKTCWQTPGQAAGQAAGYDRGQRHQRRRRRFWRGYQPGDLAPTRTVAASHCR